MAAEELVFSLELEGNLGKAAETDAQALERLREAITSGTSSLREMQTAYRNIKGSATVNIETVRQLKDRIAATKATLSANTAQMIGMKGAFEKLPKPVDASTSSLRRMLLGAEQSEGPLAGLVDKLSGMKGLLGSGLFAAGFAAVAAGLVALVAAAAAATIALVSYGIAAAGARRSEMLFLEGVSKHRNYWLEMVTGQRRAADSALVLQGAIDKVSAASPLARARIVEMQAELSRAGLRGANLTAALEGLSIVEATQGQEAAAAFKARAMGAALYGTSIKALSNDVKTRLGGIAKAQMLSLDVQQRKLHESLGLLFTDLKIEPFLKAIAGVTEMFSQSTASGRALKAMVQGFVQPIIDGIGRAGPLMKRFFQGMVIGALYAAIVVLKVRNVLRDTFGNSEYFKSIDGLKLALYGGLAVMSLFVSSALVLGAVTVAAGVLVAAFAAPFIAAGAAAYGLMAALDAVYQKIKSIDWQAAGRNVTDGIVRGLTFGGGSNPVYQAGANLGHTVLKGFKNALGIASPSKVAFAAALEVPRGTRNALIAGRPMVRSAAVGMAAATEEGMRAGTAQVSTAATPRGFAGPSAPVSHGSGAAAQKPAMVFHFDANAINITGSSAATEAGVKQSVREAVEELFEQTAHVMGAAA